MQPLIYDVAVSMDGYISGPGGDISQFPSGGPVVEDYLARLSGYAIAIMGRCTYEFGYRFGLKPGQNPYGNMRTLVFSQSADLPADSAVEVHRRCDAAFLHDLKSSAEGPVYLCGGGAFAGALLGMGAIDVLRLKRAPVILGRGVRLFDDAGAAPDLRHVETRLYDEGYLFQEFELLRKPTPGYSTD